MPPPVPHGWTCRDTLIALAIGLVAALLLFHRWDAPTAWESDGLFYEAQAREVEGEPRERALDEVMASDLAAQLRREEADEAPSERNVSNREWVDYSAQFYRRRWTVPAAAAALRPLSGDDSLKTVALIGYVAATMLLYALLRCRFGRLLSLGVALSTLLLPPVRHAAAAARVDSWGLALLTAGLILIWLTVQRGGRWLAPWILIVLTLSFTRDLTVVPIIAAAWMAFLERTRAAVALPLTGIAAAIPAPLIAGAPLRENLAYVVNDFRVPTDSSWGFVLDGYPRALIDTVSSNLTYPFEFSFAPPMVFALLVILASFTALIAVPPRGDRFASMMRAALAGSVVTVLLSVNFSEWRLELAMLPSAAVGLALLVQTIVARLDAVPDRLKEALLEGQRPESRVRSVT